VTESHWQPGPASPRLDADTVDVWLVALDAAQPDALLSPQERKRAARFLREEDRRRWTAAHVALRALLGAYAGADPRALRFDAGPHGKPALAGGNDLPRFNLSHSGDVALIAVAHGREVGVDVELPRMTDRAAAIAQRTFGAAEAAQIAALPPEQRGPAFLRSWVRWEAVLKCRGTGIGGADEASATGSEPWVVDLDVDPPAAAALAVERGPVAVLTWRWPLGG
jgi:4'-phosphopantetheinyl transferase